MTYRKVIMMALLLLLMPFGVQAQDVPISFDDVSQQVLTEQFGSAGLAWFDYNNDDWLDLYVANGPGFPAHLFANNGDGSFTDVAVEAGVADDDGTSGVVAGDIDNDGFVDLFVTGTLDTRALDQAGINISEVFRLVLSGQFDSSLISQSPTHLYHNNGDGSFTDIAESANVPGAETALSAAMADIDNDGFLDIFVTSPGSLVTLEQHENKLYRNNGDLTFTDISASAGVNTAFGACVVTFSDINLDGWQDIIVGDCNDVMLRPTPFEVFRNNGDLTFTDISDEIGMFQEGYWMGIAAGDFDRDGDVDFFSSNSSGGMNPLQTLPPPGQLDHILFQNNGDGSFTDVAAKAGLADWEWGWGASFADFDNDGFDDLFFTGSFPVAPFNIIGDGLGNPGRLLHNQGDGKFVEIGSQLGFDFSDIFTTGVAVADYDRDGDPDLSVGGASFPDADGKLREGHIALFENTTENDNHWLTVRAVGTRSNRDGIGARVTVIADDGQQMREVRAGSSFASMDSPWLMFGLGATERVTLEVVWPSGIVERYDDVPADQMVTLIEEQGIELL
ncbi:MAG: CRTAC1 family protein [Chloroflexi bacterium]|nr:MAG: CRTAC1 family protein [Chloroflexota bacterium]